MRYLAGPGMVLAFVAPLAAQGTEDALAIMKKMAANTAAATEARRQYVYHQRIRSSLLKNNGQVVCRETREYTVVPEETTTKKKLDSFSGECREGKQMAPYSAPADPTPGLKERGTAGEAHGDRESIAGMIETLASDPKSRDGIARPLFPLSIEELPGYKFSFKGETTVKGRRTYEITFEPVWIKGVCIDVGDDDSQYRFHADLGAEDNPPQPVRCRPWKGEVWVDAEDYQPLRVDTQLAKGIPWGVRVFMGINLHQFGFSLTYQRVAQGVWFPATYGTEFRVTVFWGYKRTITMAMENSDFRRTDAQSTIEFDAPEK